MPGSRKVTFLVTRCCSGLEDLLMGYISFQVFCLIFYESTPARTLPEIATYRAFSEPGRSGVGSSLMM